MGNCAARDRILVQNEKDKQLIREAEAIEPGKKKSVVRFRLHDEDGNIGKENQLGHSKSGGVRVRVVVTQRELIQILGNESKYSSVEQLLSALKMKSRKISRVGTSSSDHGGNNGGGWRPALDSIPEDH